LVGQVLRRPSRSVAIQCRHGDRRAGGRVSAISVADEDERRRVASCRSELRQAETNKATSTGGLASEILVGFERLGRSTYGL